MNTNSMMRRNFEFSNHQKFMRHKMRQKTGGAALSLLVGWTTDDEDTKEIIMIIPKKKKENNHNKRKKIKKKKNHPHSTRPGPKEKKKRKSPNLKQPSSCSYMCIAGGKEIKQQNATEKKPTACHATGHTTGSGARNEDMNFCVNMVKCTVGMSVSMLPLYEGRVPCSVAKKVPTTLGRTSTF